MVTELRINQKYLWLIIFSQISVVIYYVGYFHEHLYLPAPFIYNKADTFMDFFHTAYWANYDFMGRYLIWESVYPPLNFIFCKYVLVLFGPTEPFFDAFALRNHGVGLWYFILALFFFCALGAARLTSELRPQFKTSLLFLLIVFSPAFFFTLERGNLIVITLPLLACLFRQKKSYQYLTMALLINLKPYFVLFLLLFIFKHRWRCLLKAIAVAGSIYLLTGLSLGPDFPYFFVNLFNFSGEAQLFSPRELLSFPSSISAFSEAIETMRVTGFRSHLVGIPLDAVAFLVKWANLFVCICLIVLVAKLCAGKRFSDNYALAVFLVVLTNVSFMTGGYTLIFYPLLVPIFLGGQFSKLSLYCLIAILLPLDIITLHTENLPSQNVFLSEQSLDVSYNFSLGQIIRPLANFTLMLTLIRSSALELQKKTIS